MSSTGCLPVTRLQQCLAAFRAERIVISRASTQAQWQHRQHNAKTRSPAAQAGERVLFQRRYHSSLQRSHGQVSQHGKVEHSERRNVFVALGSNVGDSVENIENACRAIDQDQNMRIVDTSLLYRSKAMYVEDQADFVNGMCELETSLEPEQLLEHLQAIEHKMGRTKLVDKGPRNIDLDIVAYEQREVETDRLTIPHPLMHERDFVLRPLLDLQHGDKWLAEQRNRPPPSPSSMPTITPLGPPGMVLETSAGRCSTQIMSIVNMTPDSFSDGGKHKISDVHALREVIEGHIEQGATVIDIGGQSSRPNAADIGADEEIDRIMPAIEAARAAIAGRQIATSVDTYRSGVAKAAIDAGADIINDISGGLLDSDMLHTVAELGCTYVLGHTRGTPSTMSSIENCTYSQGVVHGVKTELADRLHEALTAGIRKWRIILDPGLGFAKNTEQNMILLSRLGALREHGPLRGMPWLIGSSRKRFIGHTLGIDDPGQRIWGTAATVALASRSGANVVRVHDVKEMTQVVRMMQAMLNSDDDCPPT